MRPGHSSEHSLRGSKSFSILNPKLTPLCLRYLLLLAAVAGGLEVVVSSGFFFLPSRLSEPDGLDIVVKMDDCFMKE